MFATHQPPVAQRRWHALPICLHVRFPPGRLLLPGGLEGNLRRRKSQEPRRRTAREYPRGSPPVYIGLLKAVYVPPELTAQQIEQNLRKAAEAHGKGRNVFDAELDRLYPEQEAASGDKPEMWREGEPMPDWAREALALAPPTTPED